MKTQYLNSLKQHFQFDDGDEIMQVDNKIKDAVFEKNRSIRALAYKDRIQTETASKAIIAAFHEATKEIENSEPYKKVMGMHKMADSILMYRAALQSYKKKHAKNGGTEFPVSDFGTKPRLNYTDLKYYREKADKIPVEGAYAKTADGYKEAIKSKISHDHPRTDIRGYINWFLQDKPEEDQTVDNLLACEVFWLVKHFNIGSKKPKRKKRR